MEKFLIKPFCIAFFVLYGLTSCFWIASALIIILLVLLAALHLSRPSADTVKELTAGINSVDYVIAHRGAGFDAPENTMAAFKQAELSGAKAVEFDIDFSSDGTAVVFHDDTVDRCTNGMGNLRSMRFDQLRVLDASAKDRNREQFPNERISTVDEVVQFCLSHNILMFFDFKSSPEKSAELMTSLAAKYPRLYRHAIVCSFYPNIIYKIRKADRKFVGGLTHCSGILTSTAKPTDPWHKGALLYPAIDAVLKWSMYNWLWYLCGTSFFLVKHTELSASVRDYFLNRGIQVVPWTVNSREGRNYFRHLNCPIITDTMNDAGVPDS